MSRRLHVFWFLLLAGAISLLAAARGQGPAPSAPPAFPPHWLPSRGAPAGLRYVGARVCASCHVFEASELRTPMGLASLRPAAAARLLPHAQFTLRLGAYTYRLARASRSSLRYSAAHVGHSAAVVPRWAFGLGYAGQTYLYRGPHRGWRESQVSYYRRIHALDLTIGHRLLPPPNPQAALGRAMSVDEARACFVCHTTGAVRAGKFVPQKAAPGVTCEQCHGPGSAHVAAMRAHLYTRPGIFNPGRLTPGRQSDFCGNCHRTLLMVMNMGVSGVLDVRFQPYRLSLSQCYNPADARISCLACHNPHQPRLRRLSGYDPKCLACHVRPGQSTTWQMPGKACPVAQRNCASCHMPRYALPGAHHRFFDHYIRVVRPGAPYPD